MTRGSGRSGRNASARELPGAVSSRAILMLGRVATGIRVRCFGSLAEGKLRQQHLAVLSCLRQFGEISPSELARHLELRVCELCDSIRQLHAAQYLGRDKNGRDGRKQELRLTERGRRALEDFERELDRVEAEWLAALSTEQRSVLGEALRELARALTSAAESARVARLTTAAKPTSRAQSERARRRNQAEEWERDLNRYLERERAPDPTPSAEASARAQGQGMAEDL